MYTNIEQRACDLAVYIIENKATVRAAAAQFGISKSTVHKDLTERLPRVSPALYRQVRQLLDINKADSAAFDALPGIGPYFASRMVSFRSRLGGYSYKEQLMDIYNFGSERYEGLQDLITCSRPKPYPLWRLGADSLRLHPYIDNYQAARAIVLLRDNTPRDSLKISLIEKAGILSEEQYAKLSRCVLEEP